MTKTRRPRRHVVQVPFTLEELARFNRYTSWQCIRKGQLIRRLVLEHMDAKGVK